MALARAVANGNWSSTATWNGGTLPGNGDTVAANGFTVTIDQNVTIGGANNPSVNAGSFVTGQWYQITTVGTTAFTSIGASANTVGIVFQATGAGSGTGVATALATLTTAAASPAVAGGGFTASTSTVGTINADIRAGTTVCLTVSGTGNLTLGSLYVNGGSVSGGYAVTNNSTSGTISLTSVIITSAATHALFNASSGTISINSCTLGTAGNVGGCIVNNSTGTILVSSSSWTSSGQGVVILNTSTGVVTISNSTLLSGVGTIGFAVNNAGAGTLTITGSTITSSTAGSTQAIVNGSTGTVTITSSTLTASSTASAFTGSNASANVSISGILIGSSNGYPAVYCAKWKVGTSPTGSYVSQSLNGSSTTFTWYGADYSGFGQPAVTDVRSGVSYASGTLTGTCVVPAASSVAAGVPVDVGQTGTAVLTQSAVQAALTAQGLTSTRAGNLDNLDAAVSSRSTLTPSQVQAAVIPLV